MADLNALLHKEHDEWHGISSELKAILEESKALSARQDAISKRIRELTSRQATLAAEIQKKLTENDPRTIGPDVFYKKN